MLYFILAIFIIFPVECFNLDLSDDEHNYTGDGSHALFDDRFFWSQGDIPLLNRKIFKGMRVTIREHPYIASVRRHITHYCVATMLTKNLFITVAHPFNDVPIDELGVVVGENYADRGATLLTVILLIIHEDFDRYTLFADLALIRVYEDTPYRGSVKSIQLVHPKASLDGLRAFVTGWGRCDRTGRELCLPRSSKYTPGEKFDPMLRAVTFIIDAPNLYCEGYKRNSVHLMPGMLCVGRSREEDKVTSCLAVPGAPLVVNAHLAAILSWGFGCGYDNDLPLIYTSIQYYQPSYADTTCTMERSFSTLRYVKTWFRSTMSENRLSGLCMLTVHRMRIAKAKNQLEADVLRRFSQNPRRLLLKWLVHNIPVLRHVSQENLTLLFEAKRAYILSKWLNMTRLIASEPYLPSEKTMEIMKLDRELAKLKGNVFDIRDFLFDGMHHDYKTRLYGKLRDRIHEKEMIAKIKYNNQNLSPQPFLNINDTKEILKDQLTTPVIKSTFMDFIGKFNDGYKSYDDYHW